MKAVFLSDYPIEEGAPFTGSHLQVHYVAKIASRVCESTLLAFDFKGRGRRYRDGKLDIELLESSKWDVVKLMRLLKRTLDLKPDVVYVRGRSYQLAVALTVKLLEGSFLVWSVNGDNGYLDFKYVRKVLSSERPIYRKILILPLSFLMDIAIAIGMRAADIITVQNTDQKSGVSEKFPSKSVLLLPNIQDIPQTAGRVDMPKPYFVWASARLSPVKRPELFLELAKSLPEYHFAMVGQRTENLKNLRAFPRLPRTTLHTLIREATALVITTLPGHEGTPNLAIESMLMGTPVVSIGSDFGILKRGVGVAVRSVEEAKDVLKKLVEDKRFRERLSKEAKELAYSIFVKESTEKWEAFWRDVCGGRMKN